MTSKAEWVGPLISWGLVIVGWLVINTQHNTRETRKEIRAALNDLYEMLNEIEDDAYKYHTGPGDPVLSRKIKRRVGQIFTRINLAFKNAVECRCSYEVATFRKAVTLHNFDTAVHKPLNQTDPVFEEITASRERLINVLENAFLETYR